MRNPAVVESIGSPPVVIVGAGPVGMRALRLLRESDPGVSVVVYGDESYEPYNRVQLSGLLAGRHNVADISNVSDLSHRNNHLTQYVSGHIQTIDRDAKVVVDTRGRRQAYDKLLLATGSRPFVPGLVSQGQAGVYTFRDMADAEKLAARRVLSQHTVVLGAGLLGIEAASAMQRHHTRVTLVDHNTHPMFRQLDETAGGILADELTGRGIELRLGNSIRQVLGTASVEGVVLSNGTRILCDTLVIATGIEPNKDLAVSAGLAYGRGVTVNEYMQTSDSSIYAMGECCEFEKQVYGLVAPGFDQAGIAVSHLLGDSKSQYLKPQLATSLKVAGLSVFSLGDPQSLSSLRTHVFRREGVYRRLTLSNGRIVGINAIGDWEELPVLRDLAARRCWVSPIKLLHFRTAGDLFGQSVASSVQAWPDGATVCNCNAVSCGQIRKLVGEGVDTVAELSTRTLAGSSCGSCRPLLREMVSSNEPIEAESGSAALVALALLAALIGLFALAYSQSYPDTVQLQWRWDALWRDELFKQISGFTILGLSVASLLFSLRKRLHSFQWGRFFAWRIAHVTLTLFALLALAVHTGFRTGSNLNFFLMMTFVGLVMAGAVLGASIALEHRLSPAKAGALRKFGIWTHVFLAWPLPALLGMHVWKTYYF